VNNQDRATCPGLHPSVVGSLHIASNASATGNILAPESIDRFTMSSKKDGVHP
jgi:hypothetical protein